MAIAIRLEILADGPRSGTEDVTTSLVTDQLDTTFRPGSAPLQLDWTLTEAARVLELSARLHGDVLFTCARCIEPLTYPLDVHISHHWVPAGDLEMDGDLTADFDRDPDVSEHNGVEIDIEAVVLESVLVEFPFAPDCDTSVEGRCSAWTEEPRVLHPGGVAPDIERKSPFAALGDLNLSPKADA